MGLHGGFETKRGKLTRQGECMDMRAPPDLKINKLTRMPGVGRVLPRWIWGGDVSERPAGLTPRLQLFPRHGSDAIASNDQLSNSFFSKIIFNVVLIIFLPHLPDKSSK